MTALSPSVRLKELLGAFVFVFLTGCQKTPEVGDVYAYLYNDPYCSYQRVRIIDVKGDFVMERYKWRDSYIDSARPMNYFMGFSPIYFRDTHDCAAPGLTPNK